MQRGVGSKEIWRVIYTYFLNLLQTFSPHPTLGQGESATFNFVCRLGIFLYWFHSCQPSRNGRDSPGRESFVPVVSRLVKNTRNVPEFFTSQYIITNECC